MSRSRGFGSSLLAAAAFVLFGLGVVLSDSVSLADEIIMQPVPACTTCTGCVAKGDDCDSAGGCSCTQNNCACQPACYCANGEA